jgi:hypothetical protein
MRDRRTGTKHSRATRLMMSLSRGGSNNHFLGKTHTTEAKSEIGRKSRILRLKRLVELGIPVNEDRGAKEWFTKLNAQGFNYHPRVFLKETECGYVADGYDENLHIWYEYDTPYHRKLSQKQKDLVRQQNIIRHFKGVGHPLRHFIRAHADESGKVLCETYINS